MKTVMITGANGFIARHIAATLKESHHVIGVSRSGAPLPHFQRVYQRSLGKGLTDILRAESIDVVVHTANDTSTDSYRLNVDGTLGWFKEARQAGADLQVLLSSLSARPDALADYGRSKYALERRFLDANEVVLRLGLVVGPGGLFGEMVNALRRPIVPLLDGGAPRVYVQGIDFLSHVICRCLEKDGTGFRGRIWHIQQPEPYTLREVLRSMRRVYGLGCRFVSVPSLLALWAVRILEVMRITLPVSSNNIKGLRQCRYDDFPSDFSQFSDTTCSLDELMRMANRAGGPGSKAPG